MTIDRNDRPEPFARRMLTRWGKLWHVPRLRERVTVRFSARLTKSLGRVRLATGSISLNARLQFAPRAFLIEVLCHEAAHVAARLLHGPQAKPHGPEWRDLMHRAGYTPATMRAHPDLPPAKPRASSVQRRRHRYRCPICQQDFFVRRKDSRLRCNVCQPGGRPEPLQPFPDAPAAVLA